MVIETSFEPQPKSSSKSCIDFFESWGSINAFVNWVSFMAVSIDQMQDIARKALDGSDNAETLKNLQKDGGKREKNMVDVLSENRQIFMEIALARHVENYLNYLSSLLQEIFVHRPETLKSSEKVEISEILKYEDIGEFVRWYASKKVEMLSYSSFSDLKEFYINRFSISLISEEKALTIIEAIETRNISVHNKCIINERYVKRTGCKSTKIGKLKVLGIDYIKDASSSFAESVCNVDTEATGKLGINKFDI